MVVHVVESEHKLFLPKGRLHSYWLGIGPWGGGEGGTSSNGLLNMYCWMISHFRDWTGYNGVTFLGSFNRVTTENGVKLFQDFKDFKKSSALKD